MARHRTTSTAPLIENDTNDPPPTSQPTDDNPLTDLQDRQRAPLKLLSRCLENRTRIESPTSEISELNHESEHFVFTISTLALVRRNRQKGCEVQNSTQNLGMGPRTCCLYSRLPLC